MEVIAAMILALVASSCMARPAEQAHWDDHIFRKHPFEYDYMKTPALIESFGYTAQIHHVETEDGYILELHRIPHGIRGPSNEPRPVALLQHCLLCSSSDWVMDKPDRALAYLLADAGYDVWLSNVRGNSYSRNHTSKSPEGKEFWQFTWGEMAHYDMPATIDYILDKTGHPVLHYIGFSMGTTIFFAMLSDKPHYKEKIKSATLMAPVVYVDLVKGLLSLVEGRADQFDTIMSLLGHHEFLPRSNLTVNFAAEFCDEETDTAELCHMLLYMICGPDPEELNTDNLPVYLSHTPAGTSLHTVTHYGQLMESGAFSKFDWGRKGNNEHYGQSTPPHYDLQVDMPPIALFWGANDWLAVPESVARLVSEIKNVQVNHKISWEKWNHLDFVWGIHAKEYVYDHVLKYLSEHI